MKKLHFIQIGILAAAIAGTPLTANAQQPAAGDASGMPHLQPTGQPGQYPSLIQINGDAVGAAANTKFSLRCGYAMNGNQMILDPTVNDLSITNVSANAYARYQFIDGKPIIATADPSKAPAGGLAQILFQVTEPDGSFKTKSCSLNLRTDTPQECVPAKPFTTADQSKAAVAAMAKQCSDFLSQMAPQIDASIYNAQKTQEWKAKLHQTLMVIEQ